MFPAVDQTQPEEPEDATCKTACTSPPYTRTSVPVQQSADGNQKQRHMWDSFGGVGRWERQNKIGVRVY